VCTGLANRWRRTGRGAQAVRCGPSTASVSARLSILYPRRSNRGHVGRLWRRSRRSRDV